MKVKGIISVLLVLISPLLYADIVSYIAVQQSYLENWFINANIIVLRNQSLIKCSLQCGILDECMSISYHKGSKECIWATIGYIVKPTLLGYTSVGWSFYLVLDERCPDVTGYVFSKAFNSCYKVHAYDNILKYDNYSQICESEGGELMKIDSDEKQQHIVIFLDQFDISNWIYFQGTHLLSEPTWRYDNGSVISYFNWHPSQPDSTTSDTSEYLCMRKSDQYQWHDCWKAMIGAFICEKKKNNLNV